MKTLFWVVFTVTLFCVAVSDAPKPTPVVVELSWDNGTPAFLTVVSSGSGCYAGCDYLPPTTPSGPWYLHGIKYYTSINWPDTVAQGFNVACWGMSGGQPSNIIWPLSGVPVYNPNTGGGWILRQVPESEKPLLSGSFLVGIGFLYSYPACDALGYDGTGAGPHDWEGSGSIWSASAIGKLCVRAQVDNDPAIFVEPRTLGEIRTLYR